MITTKINSDKTTPERVTHAIIGGAYTNFADQLTKQGITLLYAQPNPYLTLDTQNHADMAAINAGGKIFLAPNQIDLHKQILKLNMNVEIISKQPQSGYPNDVLLNAAVSGCGGIAFLNQDYINREVLSHLRLCGTKTLHVKQGYARCSICFLSSNAIITADRGIADVADKNELDVLTIKPGYITLAEREYGFIGGASALIDKDHLIFFGNISAHPDYEKIKSFAANHSVYLESLSGECLTDIGGIVAF